MQNDPASCQIKIGLSASPGNIQSNQGENLNRPLVVKAICSDQGNTVQSLQSAKILATLRLLHGTEPVCWLTRDVFIAAHSTIFAPQSSSMVIQRRQGIIPQNEHLTSTVLALEHLEQGLGLGLCQMCGSGLWAVIITIEQPQSNRPEKAWPLFFLDQLKILSKQWPMLRVFLPVTLVSRTAVRFGFKDFSGTVVAPRISRQEQPVFLA